jgi:amino acid permease
MSSPITTSHLHHITHICIASHHITSHHITSHHITSHTSHHITSFLLLSPFSPFNKVNRKPVDYFTSSLVACNLTTLRILCLFLSIHSNSQALLILNFLVEGESPPPSSPLSPSSPSLSSFVEFLFVF